MQAKVLECRKWGFLGGGKMGLRRRCRRESREGFGGVEFLGFGVVFVGEWIRREE